MTEITENTRLKLGIKDILNVLVIIIGITVSFLTNKISTQYEIDTLKEKVDKLEKINPELLQWQLNNVNEKIEEIKKTQTKQNEMIEKIYDLIIK